MRDWFGCGFGGARKSSKPGSRRPFSPRRRALALEPLEDRRLLSVGGLGVVGDSLSDEYFDQTGSCCEFWRDFSSSSNWSTCLTSRQG